MDTTPAFPTLRIVSHPLVQHKVSLLRARTTPTKIFKELVDEIATLIAYEATSALALEPAPVETPLERTTGMRVSGKKLTLVPILRAGLGMVEGVARLVPSVSLFAYGTGGYGTLQELMILNRYVDSVRPDLIVWQLSANDLVNNDYFLETKNPAGARMLRPFYENGEVVHRFPSSSSVVKYSRLVRFVSARVAMIRGHGFNAASLERERRNYPDALERSIGTTRLLMRRATERAGQIPIVAFVAEGDSYADSVLQSAAVASGWRFIPGIRDSIDAERARGLRVDGMPRDGHWNAHGHAIAGRVIARSLRSGGILRKHHRGDDGGGQDGGNDQE